MKKFILLLIVSLFFTSCQSTKDAFTLKKKSTADEFLVEKKNPLVLPPDYGKLPIPENAEENINQIDDDEIKILVNNETKKSSNGEKNLKPTSIEKSILEKIE
tara:strand:- start:134 stop:442 length:309 start_codon:yes stop_codon:yes gene_type:complete